MPCPRCNEKMDQKPEMWGSIACAAPDYIARQRAHNKALSDFMHRLAERDLAAR